MKVKVTVEVCSIQHCRMVLIIAYYYYFFLCCFAVEIIVAATKKLTFQIGILFEENLFI